MTTIDDIIEELQNRIARNYSFRLLYLVMICIISSVLVFIIIKICLLWEERI